MAEPGWAESNRELVRISALWRPTPREAFELGNCTFSQDSQQRQLLDDASPFNFEPATFERQCANAEAEFTLLQNNASLWEVDPYMEGMYGMDKCGLKAICIAYEVRSLQN